MVQKQMLSKPPLIEIEALSKVYQLGRSEIRALDHLSFVIKAGEFVALMGPSGSGKSTLLHLIGCLDTPTSGSYRLAGRDVSHLSKAGRARLRNEKIGFIFQSFNLLPRLDARGNVALPLQYRRSPNPPGSRAAAVLGRVGLAERLDHRPNELSGGQQQRVAIARALVTDPALILADEPTGNLDSQTGGEIMALLQTLNRDDGRTIILVTHDPLVAEAAGRVLHLRDGRLERESGA